MSPLFLIGAALLAAAISYALTPFAGWLSLKTGAIDVPGPRKIHHVPIPRLGGVAVLLSMGLTVLLTQATGLAELRTAPLLAFAAGLAPVLLVSLIDDIRSTPAVVKFVAHGIGAAIVVSLGLRLGDSVHILGTEMSIAPFAAGISWMWIVGVTNAFNLADGLDGLSAGLALISAISLAAVAVVMADSSQAMMSMIVVGSLIGFLPFNTFPAKIFFGDTGAASIGFTLACLGLWGSSRMSSGMAVLVPILVMGIPITDAVVTICRRALRPLIRNGNGDLFAADQEHIHHKLLRKGFDHRGAVRLLYFVGVAIALIALLSIFLKSQSAAIVVLTLLVAAAFGIRELDYDEFAIVRNGLVFRMYNATSLRTGAFRVFIDMALVTLSVYGAFVLKFDEWHLRAHRETAVNLVVVMLPTTLLVFRTFGLYRRSWRYSNLEDLIRTIAAIGVTVAVGGAIGVLGLDFPGMPTYFIIFALILVAFVLAVRVSFRTLLYWQEHEKAGGERVLVYGADQEGAMALQDLFWNRSTGLQPVGFIDDDPRNLNRLVNGFAVVGDIRSLKELTEELHVTGLIIGSSKLSAEQMQLARQQCGLAGIWLKGFRIELHALPTGEVSLDAQPAPQNLAHTASTP